MKKPYTPQDRIRVVAMLTKGKLAKEISKATKISEQTIRTWGKAANELSKKLASAIPPQGRKMNFPTPDSPVRPVVSHNEVLLMRTENKLLTDKVKDLKEEKIVLLRIIRSEI